jgi:hypothetical protein
MLACRSRWGVGVTHDPAAEPNPFQWNGGDFAALRNLMFQDRQEKTE